MRDSTCRHYTLGAARRNIEQRKGRESVPSWSLYTLSRVSLAVVIAITSLLLPSPSAGVESRLWAGHRSPLSAGASGVNGYVRHSGTNMNDCPNQFFATWLGVGEGAPTNKWVQIGQTQGTLLDNCSSSDTRIYAEQVDCNFAKFKQWDLGNPPSPNYPVYVNATSVINVDPCTGGQDRQYAFRIGSFTSAPKAYGYVHQLPDQVDALQEVMWTTSRPDMNTDRFGLNDAGNVQSGYQISVLKSGTWKSWTPSWVPNSSVREDAPLNHLQNVAFYAFRVTD